MTVGEVVESRADGFAAGRHRLARVRLARLRRRRGRAPALGGLGTLTRLDTELAPAQRYLGPLGGMGLTAYAGLFDVAGLREGDVVWVSAAAGRGRKPRRAVREAPRPSGDRQRRLRREGRLPARRARARRRLQPPGRPRGRPAARGRARGHRRLLRLRRRRPPRSGARGAAPVGTGRALRSRLRVRAPRTRARPTSSRRPPTTSRCAASAAAATCTGWATWCAT